MMPQWLLNMLPQALIDSVPLWMLDSVFIYGILLLLMFIMYISSFIYLFLFTSLRKDLFK